MTIGGGGGGGWQRCTIYVYIRSGNIRIHVYINMLFCHKPRCLEPLRNPTWKLPTAGIIDIADHQFKYVMNICFDAALECTECPAAQNANPSTAKSPKSILVISNHTLADSPNVFNASTAGSSSGRSTSGRHLESPAGSCSTISQPACPSWYCLPGFVEPWSSSFVEGSSRRLHVVMGKPQLQG